MSTRSLMPKEHGAYGQLAFPALSALALGEPTLAAGAVSVSACAAFVAHEPLLVLLGRRGARARREDGARAARAFAIAAFVAGASAVVALARAPAQAWTLAPAALLATLVVPFVITGREKSLVGELLVVAALSALALPIATMSGVPARTAAWLCCVWAAGFGLATVGVREAMRQAREPGQATRLPLVAPAAAVVALGVSAALGWWLPLAVVPFVAASAQLIVAPPPPRHIRRVGWALIGASALTFAAVAALAR